MIGISASAINSKSPYKVIQTQHNSFQFTTDYGNVYEVGFVVENMFDFDGVYQFYIEEKISINKRFDAKIEQVIVVILEEFFSHQNAILDYICDTSDGKQAARNRLFMQWIRQHADAKNYSYRNLSVEVEGITFYASVLLKKDSTIFDSFMQAVNSFEKDLFSKTH